MNQLNRIVFLVLLFWGLSYSQTPKCAYCSGQIERTYISFEGNIYHEACYRQFIQPRCAKCTLPIDGKFIIEEGKKYHEICYNKSVALRCSLCGDVISGSYTIDYWGNKYHSHHDKTDERCDYCERFISPVLTNGGSKYSDGRMICNLCESSAIKSNASGEPLFNNVRNSLARLGIRINHNRINLKVVDKNELQSVAFANQGITDARGFAEYTYYQSGDRIERKSFTVYVLSGMPRKEFEAVAAHELMHVWQYLNSTEKLDAQLREGSAEFAAFLHMNKYRDEESRFVIQKIATNSDATYGGGFRMVKKIVDEKGIGYLLNKLAN